MKPKQLNFKITAYAVLSIILLSASLSAAQSYPLTPDSSQIKDAMSYLKSCQNEDGGFGADANSNSSIGTTNWAVIAIASIGEDPHNWIKNGNSPIDFMSAHANELDNEINVATAYERFLLALVASGEDPRNFNGTNYVEKVKSFYNSTTKQIGDPTLLNDDFWGVLALVAANESSSIEVKNSVKFIKENQNQDGGWGYALGADSDSNDVAIAIQALIASGESPESSVLKNATNNLKTFQNNDGGFSWSIGYLSDSSSDSWVIQAIVASGDDPRNWTKNNSNPVEHLLSLQQDDGSFNWTMQQRLNPCKMTTDAILALLGKPYPILPSPKTVEPVTVRVRVEGQNSTIFNGEVSFSNSTIVDTNNVTHYLSAPTALGALDAASKFGNFSYEVVYYSEWDSLYVRSIENDTDGWQYWIDYTLPMVGADKYTVENGSNVLWGYSLNWSAKPLGITLSKYSVNIEESFNVTVYYYNSTGWTTPLSNATVYVDSLEYITDANGNATISLENANRYTVFAEMDGYIRSEKKTISVTVKGDFNGNDRVDIGDVTYVAYMIVGKVPMDLKADFNGNGRVDIGDASKIAYYLVGKIDTL